MPTTAIALLDIWDVAHSFSLVSLPASNVGRIGAPPDHSIGGILITGLKLVGAELGRLTSDGG